VRGGGRRLRATGARRQQIASLDAVQWAMLETSGAISFIKKPS
jgi:uncharacterized membrane protein YcaP (DUF421 family)